MRLVLVLAALLAGGLTATQQQQPCKGPPYLMGKLIVTIKKNHMTRTYEYDTALQRMKVSETETSTNQSFTFNYLLYFSEGVMYEIDKHASKCTKRPLKADYQIIGVPHDADFLDTYVLGSLSTPNTGVRMNLWMGFTPEEEEYLMTVTEPGCVHVDTIYYTRKYGQVGVIFLNHTMSTTSNDLSPPRFCPDVKAKPEGSPVTFFSLFFKSKSRHLMRALTKLKSAFV